MKQEHDRKGITAAELVKDRQAIGKLAQSSDAKKLVELLNRQNGDVKQAAQSAAAGDPSGLMAIIERLTSTKEGAELVERLGNQAKQAGLE